MGGSDEASEVVQHFFFLELAISAPKLLKLLKWVAAWGKAPNRALAL